MRTATAFAMLLSTMFSSSTALAAEHRNLIPTAIHMDKTRPCVLFTLEGITGPADPAINSSDFFAVSTSHPQFAQIYAILLTARASNRKVNVFTTGQSACAHAELDMIVIL